MKIYHVAALSENGVIGRDNKIPWQIREDLRRFREITLGHPVIMGRKTYESMLPYAPLKGRFNIVLSASQDKILYEGRVDLRKTDGVKSIDEKGTKVTLVSSLDEAFDLCRHKQEVYVIGGSRVYEETLGLADELRLTIVHQDIKGGDTFYPDIDPNTWVPSYVKPHEGYTFIDYVRAAVRGEDT